MLVGRDGHSGDDVRLILVKARPWERRTENPLPSAPGGASG